MFEPGFRSFWIIVILLLPILRCTENEVPEPQSPLFELADFPLNKLSDYNFFVGEMKELQPNSGVLPYDLNSALFSNYAEKQRFVYIPNGGSAIFDEKKAFDFPEGSVLIKNFYYNNLIDDPSSGRKILETRLLVKKAGVWKAATYIWNDEQNEATYNIVGKKLTASWTHYDGVNIELDYFVPNQNDCKGCHELNKALVPIGPKARHLNKDYDYGDRVVNQLVEWQNAGYLTGLPALSEVEEMPIWDDPTSGSLDSRARAYIDINCAHCHNENGPANNSGLFMNFDQDASFTLGICKPPIAAGEGSGGLRYSIVPGDPEASIMVFRMESLEIDVAMPELSRSIVHDEGVELIRQWILEMDGSCD